MMLEREFYRFDGASLHACQDQISEVRLAAADSFLVEDGRTRSLNAHLERFAGWVEAVSPFLRRQLDDYFASALAHIPQSGRWFPRFELHLATTDGTPDTDSLYFTLRTAPDQLGAMKLWTLDEADPRLNPAVKGPDLSLCMQLRRKAQLHGADEAVILDASGYICEGALSSLVWWQGDILCAPDSQTPWLQSVTRNEVFEIAQTMGFQTRLVRAKPADIVGCAVWALSSLQGIREVSEWVNLGSPVGRNDYYDKFQKRLRMLSGPLTSWQAH